MLKGIIIYFNNNGQPLYEYMPLNILEEDFIIWEKNIMEKHSNLSWMKNIYWKLDELSCVLVLRNKLWFNFAKPILNDFWNLIEYEKINGYSHRAPNKRIKIINNEITTNKCLINIEQFNNIIKLEENTCE